MAHSDELPASGIEIVLADDHTMVRRGLRMVLDAEPGHRPDARSPRRAEAA